jgi:hypothetical protein
MPESDAETPRAVSREDPDARRHRSRIASEAQPAGIERLRPQRPLAREQQMAGREDGIRVDRQHAR